MKILVVSHQHGLLPFAWRLKREGHEVSTVVVSPRYQAAWAGRLDKETTGELKREDLERWKEPAATGELVVLTDSTKAMEAFTGAPMLYGTWTVPGSAPAQLYMGAWFSDMGEWHDPHWFFPDWGLWPGGFGPTVLAGGVLVRTSQAFKGPLVLLDALTDSFTKENYRGLVQLGLQWVPAANEFQVCGVSGGPTWLHMHAFVAGLTNFGETLGGAVPTFEPKQFVVVAPVSQPPWPIKGAPGSKPTDLNIPSELTKDCFFHAISLEGGQLRTAGLDGLIGVVRGSANVLELARAQALKVAAGIGVPERQVRLDVGTRVGEGLAQLETLGLY